MTAIPRRVSKNLNLSKVEYKIAIKQKRREIHNK
jgi:hypothetical protein